MSHSISSYASYLPNTESVASTRLEVLVYQEQAFQPKTDHLLVEAPVAIVYNGISYATMLVTPIELEEFARGFTLTEGIVAASTEIRDVEVQHTSQGWVCYVEIASERLWKLKEKKRALAGRTGCGLCGVESLEQMHRIEQQLPLHAPSISVADIMTAFQTMRTQQTLFESTGACHAAAYFHPQHARLLVAEDVGRHNALDKLIGKVMADVAPAERMFGAILVSSRASYEMVQKTVLAGVPVLAAVSAPTALAVQEARLAHLGLLGFVRQQTAVVYSTPERFISFSASL